VGTPHEIYESPSTAFAAAFIGRMNVIEGTLSEDGVVTCGSITLRAASSVSLARGSKAVVCIRPHHVVLNANGASGTNRAMGHVIRQTYLGEVRDYLIELPAGLQLRAFTDPALNHPVGSEVMLDLPIERCRIVEA
ncbi:MAG: TOBE domain-containing protein, partial [Vulcanimicrobiaceae bacterium]